MEGITIEFVSTFLIWILYGCLLFLWFIDGRVRKEQVIHALAAGLIAAGISLLIKHLYPTFRPFVVNGGETSVLIRPTDGAFPSIHAALSFSLAVTIFMHDRKAGWGFLLGALFIGIARVMANVHYPQDILGGAFIGTLVAVIIEHNHMFSLLRRDKQII